jgi:hypothetical protein
MYPLGMTRSLAAAAAVVLSLAAPAGASAASLVVSPQKDCYSSGESVNLLGSAFSPLGSVSITRDGDPVGSLNTDASGAFNGILTLAQNSGRQAKTYTATDGRDGSLTASAQITVSAVRVGLRPSTGAPGRRLRINARGFTTGKTLWAHVVRGRSKRHIRIGRLRGACGNLTARRRLLRPGAALGVYTIQFDTFRRYRASRPVRDRYTITVRAG